VNVVFIDDTHGLLFRALQGMSYSEGIASVEEFETQWCDFFRTTPDLFELQRGLNNCFGYDIVPTIPILEEAFRAARRLNDFGTTLRIQVGLRDKVEKDEQYAQYMEALDPIRKELGVPTPEELGL
jgi:cytochrome c oxidase subunit 5a